ncbi:DUF397 domain-containing protein [Saccharothrix sp. BKS2]|uniref:DUF397 domain-containing protein n=1 Tax=Saccharothrix sp. BKS2 TaxID=3064400 RepID=UPI0039EB180C
MTREWVRSSYSTASGECVEVWFGGGVVRVRDSKDGERGPVISLGPGWGAFVRGVRDGRFRG